MTLCSRATVNERTNQCGKPGAGGADARPLGQTRPMGAINARIIRHPTPTSLFEDAGGGSVSLRIASGTPAIAASREIRPPAAAP